MNLMEITKGYEPKQNEQTDQTKNSLYTTDKWKLLAKEQAEMLEKVTVEKDELQVRNQKMNEFIQKFQERTHKLKMEKQNLFFENHEMQDEIRKLNDEIHRLTTELSETQKHCHYDTAFVFLDLFFIGLFCRTVQCFLIGCHIGLTAFDS